jgi:DNA-binding CsgD family transcriptional regulator
MNIPVRDHSRDAFSPIANIANGLMPRFAETTLPRLLELLYDAAVDPRRWQAFLDALSSPFGGANGILYEYNYDLMRAEFSFGFGNDPAYISSYIDHFQHINPYQYLSRNAPVGIARMTSSLAIDVESVLRSEFYNDWMRPQGIAADHIGLLIRRGAASHATFGMAPAQNLLTKHSDKYIRHLTMLIPHITRALEINRITGHALNAQKRAEQVAGVTLEAFDAAAFVLTAQGRVIRMNARGEAMARGRTVLGLDSSGTLQATHHPSNALLSAIMKRLTASTIAGRSQASDGPLRLPSIASGDTYLAWLLAVQPDSGIATPDTFAGPHTTRPMLLVLVQSEATRSPINPREIETVFNLSTAEARLVSALAAGRSTTQFAESAGLSQNTVRNQLASVFAKTETRRQAELVSMVVQRLLWRRVINSTADDLR